MVCFYGVSHAGRFSAGTTEQVASLKKSSFIDIIEMNVSFYVCTVKAIMNCYTNYVYYIYYTPVL